MTPTVTCRSSNPENKWSVHLQGPELVSQQQRQCGVKSIGEIKERDPHCAPNLVHVGSPVAQKPSVAGG